MSEVQFYHLQRQSLDQALPPLLERMVGSHMRARRHW
jgi:DNA polymerase IIIc chi subunit